MKTPKTILKSLINSSPATSRLLHGRSLRSNPVGFLRLSGWFVSAQTHRSIDQDGKAIPWITYSSRFFIEPRLKKTQTLFEYGSGNSTLWWAEHVKSVTSVEHAGEWFEIMKDKLPSNVTYLFHKLEEGAYAESIRSQDCLFDIVVIDGRDRNRCTENAIQKLSAGGVIIYDNSEREKYQPSFDLLKANGFKRLDFFGMGPIASIGWNTSIFYRNQNCFEI